MPRNRPTRFVTATVVGLVLAVVATPSPAGHFGASTFVRDVRSIPSATPTETEFLTGARGAPATIGIHVAVPAPLSARVPAVVILHGSTGITPTIHRWAEDIGTVLGIAVAKVDSFSGRGVVETTTDPSRLPNTAMAIDAYRTLAMLAGDPRIDARRIAVLGFSDGGFAALYASVRRFQRLYAPPGREFAAYLAFYPPCGQRYANDEDVSERPIRIFHGAADDWAPIEPCRNYVARLKQLGRDADLIAYPGAHHAFDVPELPTALRLPGARRRGCALDERTLGVVVDSATGRPPDAACLRQGATIGHDPRARDDAAKRVKEILIAAFGG